MPRIAAKYSKSWSEASAAHCSKNRSPMSALGHSQPSHFVLVLNNVRYASDSDHSRYESELTLWANSGHRSGRRHPLDRIDAGLSRLLPQRNDGLIGRRIPKRLDVVHAVEREHH